MSFDWNDLQHFLAVARAGTVSQAAKRMGLNHATLIRRIEALEHALGAKLFERYPRGYLLTPRGERLLETAEAIEGEALKVDRDVASSMSHVGGVLRISTLEGFGNFFLSRRLPKLAAQYPNLMVELSIVQQDVALLRRESDLAVTLRPPEGEGFSCERLSDFDLFLYSTPAYLERHPPIRQRADLLGHCFCSYIDRVSFVRGVDYLSEISNGLAARVQSSSLFAQMSAIKEGFGMGVLPAFVAMAEPGLIRVLPETVALTRTYWLVSGSGSAAGPRVHAARRFIREEVIAARSLLLQGPA